MSTLNFDSHYTSIDQGREITKPYYKVNEYKPNKIRTDFSLEKSTHHEYEQNEISSMSQKKEKKQ